jgi:hypothetical protein
VARRPEWQATDGVEASEEGTNIFSQAELTSLPSGCAIFVFAAQANAQTLAERRAGETRARLRGDAGAWYSPGPARPRPNSLVVRATTFDRRELVRDQTR